MKSLTMDDLEYAVSLNPASGICYWSYSYMTESKSVTSRRSLSKLFLNAAYPMIKDSASVQMSTKNHN